MARSRGSDPEGEFERVVGVHNDTDSVVTVRPDFGDETAFDVEPGEATFVEVPSEPDNTARNALSRS